MARLNLQYTDNIWIELGLNLEPTAPPVDFAQILLARSSRVCACSVNLEGSTFAIDQFYLDVNLTSVCP